jgi:hypothetical protein
MIKDSDNRLGKAVQDLRELVVRISVIFLSLPCAPPDARLLEAASQVPT